VLKLVLIWIPAQRLGSATKVFDLKVRHEAKSFGVIMARVSKVLMETEKAEHIYSLISGNSVPHLHMHLVASYPNTPEKYWRPMAVYY
jgi:diadenosine tetraphosphate (Ap4A) HIT family hydrolase